MDLQLEGKRALVTGSTAGIGFAAALALAEEGACVVVNGRTEARVEEARKRIEAAVPAADVSGIATDVSVADGVKELIDRLPDVDILVNNVGIFEPKPFEQITDEDWLRFFETNVMSGVRLTRHYLPRMKESNWGRILFISSESAIYVPVEMIHYGMTKTAQLAIARGVAETTVGTGVTVNSILPGPTKSEGVGTLVAKLAEDHGTDTATIEKEFFRTTRPSSLLQRFISPEEVASLIVFGCSPRSSAINGAALRVEGGIVRSIV